MQTINIKTEYIGGSGEFVNQTPSELFLTYFPDVEIENIVCEGNYDDGIMVFNKEDKTQFIVIKPRKYRLESVERNSDGKAIDVTTSDARTSHVEQSALTNAPNVVKAYAVSIAPNYFGHYRNQESRSLPSGLEEEYILIDSNTGEFIPYKGRELLEGTNEKDVFSKDAVSTALDLAKLRQTAQAETPNALILDVGTTPSGSPQNTIVNVEHEVYGLYIAGIEHLLLSLGYGPAEVKALQEIMQQVSEFHGYLNYEEMALANGNRLNWVSFAGHINIGLPHTEDHKVDVDNLLNQLFIMTSELSSVVEIFSASTPFIWGVAPKVTNSREEKVHVRDVRTFYRAMMRTTHYPSFPIQSVDQLIADIANNIKTTDRLDRTGLSYVDENIEAEDEELLTTTSTAHGMARIRVTYNGKNEGRIEYTGAGGNFIKTRVVCMSILRYLGDIAAIATAKGLKVQDFIEQETGIPANDVWGDSNTSESTVKEYMFEGPKSARLKLLLDKLGHIINIIEIPGAKDHKQIALAAIQNLKYTSKNLCELAATGKGSLGDTLIYYTQESGLEISKLIHAFQTCEANFIASLENEEMVMKYLTGQIGFRFDDNFINYLDQLENYVPEIIYNFEA